jgi:ABC-type polysaccharide/polyol phosphate transport system ATPase subunit
LSAIELEAISLWRRRPDEHSLDFKRQVFALVRRNYRRPTRRKILDEVSLSVPRGEKLGIIGPNGSGKSTLLKVICGILLPSSGRVKVEGHVAPLIELGAGFDPDLSVSDNIQLYGILLGHSRAEMKEKTDEILAFSELEEYRDVPVQTLSSGMIARLGFAIATDTSPDILILDEVLAVGDEAFRNKSRSRIENLWREHVTVLVVSHELNFIREACANAIWMEEGRIIMAGPAPAVVEQYLEAVRQAAEQRLTLAMATLEARLGR